MSEKQKEARALSGVVVSNKMDKTIMVSIERTVKHPLYNKYLRRRTRVLAHDENNECNEGDRVVIESSRPISKQKAWHLRRIVDRAEQV